MKGKQRYERNRSIQVLQNPLQPKITRKGWQGQLVLHKELVMIQTVPTHQYLDRTLEQDSITCYPADMEQTAGGWDMKTEPGSKLHHLKISYERFDAHQKDLVIDCLDGCSQCCNDLFYISETEFFGFLTDMLQRKQYGKIYRCYQKAKLQEAYLKENFPPAYKQMISNYEPTDERYYNLGYTIASMVSCPMLSDKGRCIIYKNRPVICRIYGTTRTCSFIGNPSRIYLEKELRCETLYDPNAMEQPRPIWYWLVNRLKKDNFLETLQKIKQYNTTRV